MLSVGGGGRPGPPISIVCAVLTGECVFALLIASFFLPLGTASARECVLVRNIGLMKRRVRKHSAGKINGVWWRWQGRFFLVSLCFTIDDLSRTVSRFKKIKKSYTSHKIYTRMDRDI